jgi:hypothetical protein
MQAVVVNSFPRLTEKHTVRVKKHTMPKAISSWLCVAVSRIGTGKCTIIYLFLANKFMLLVSQVPLHLTGFIEVDEDKRVNFLFLQLASEDIEEEISVDDVVDEIDRVSK